MEEGVCGDTSFRGSWLLCQLCCNLKAQENQCCPKHSGNGHPSAAKVVGQSADSLCRRGGKKKNVIWSPLLQCCRGGELNPWFRSPSINCLKQETSEHCQCAAFHVCFANHSGSVLLPCLLRKYGDGVNPPNYQYFPCLFPVAGFSASFLRYSLFYIVHFKAGI